MMQEGRITKLLKDARAHVSEPQRPETPLYLSRQLSSRSCSRTILRRLSNVELLSPITPTQANDGASTTVGGNFPSSSLPSQQKLNDSSSTINSGPEAATDEPQQEEEEKKSSSSHDCLLSLAGTLSELLQRKSPQLNAAQDDATALNAKLLFRQMQLYFLSFLENLDLVNQHISALSARSETPPTEILMCLYNCLQYSPALEEIDDAMEAANAEEEEDEPLSITALRIPVRTGAILLRSLRTPPSAVVRVLHELCRNGNTLLLKDEQLIDPLIQLLLQISLPQRSSSTNSASGPLESPTLRHTMGIIRSFAHEQVLHKSLVTLGVIPALSSVLKRFLEAPLPKSDKNDDNNTTQAGADGLLTFCDTVHFLLDSLKYLAKDYSHLVLKSAGIVEALSTDVVEKFCSISPKVSLSAGRVLAQLSYCGECLQQMRNAKSTVTGLSSLEIVCNLLVQTIHRQQQEKSLQYQQHCLLLIARLTFFLANLVNESDELLKIFATRCLQKAGPVIAECIQEIARDAFAELQQLHQLMEGKEDQDQDGNAQQEEEEEEEESSFVMSPNANILKKRRKNGRDGIRKQRECCMFLLEVLSNLVHFGNNLTLSEEVAMFMLRHTQLTDVLVYALGEVECSPEDTEEEGENMLHNISSLASPSRTLMLYVLMCLSNISFYLQCLQNNEQELDYLQQTLEGLGPLLLAILLNSDDRYLEATVEATRLLGNVSAFPLGRKWMEEKRMDEICILLSGHADDRLRFNSLGVLINFTADVHSRIYGSKEEPEETEGQGKRPNLLKSLDARLVSFPGSARVEEDEACAPELVELAHQIRRNLATILCHS